MKKRLALFCASLLLMPPLPVLAAEWVEAVPLGEGKAIFIDNTSFSVEDETVHYWKRMMLDDKMKPAKLKDWEKKRAVGVREYKVHVIENCKTGALQFETPVLTDVQGLAIEAAPDEVMSLFPWPTYVVPDSPSEILHQFVCAKATQAVAQQPGSEIKASPQDTYQNSDDPLWNRPSYQKKVASIGQKILQANGIEQAIGFRVVNEEEVNANASDLTGQVTIYSAYLKYIDNDDELAGILGHEIAHILLKHSSKSLAVSNVFASLMAGLALASNASTGNPWLDLWNRQVAIDSAGRLGSDVSRVRSKRREMDADIMGIDLMVKAGYNPNARIALQLKSSGDSNLPSYQRTHPLTSERVAMIKKHIAAKYPQFIPASEQLVNTSGQQPATPSPILSDEDVAALKRIQAEGQTMKTAEQPSVETKPAP